VSQNDGNIITVSGARHVIDGIGILGGAAALNDQYGIVAQSDFCTIKNTDIRNIARAGIVMQGSYGHIEGNWLNHCSVGTFTDAASVNSIHVTGDHTKTVLNHLSDTESGIAYIGTATNFLIGGLIEGNTMAMTAGATGAQGVTAFYAQHLRVALNYIENFAMQSIYLSGCQYSNIVGNNVYRCNYDGIFVGHGDTKAIAITGNTIREAVTGVKIYDHSQQVNVTGNEISNCGWGVIARGSVATGELPLSNIRIEDERHYLQHHRDQRWRHQCGEHQRPRRDE
jgi:parallel beta-helix repeat protein